MKILLCSRNRHKLRELEAALPDWEIRPLAADGYPDESATTFEENAREKAQFGRPLAPAEAWVVGEDSGVEVDALGGRPGVHSARWADDPVSHLLAELGETVERRARYRCAIVAIGPGGQELAVEGTLEGSIALEPRGDEGFGYDPIFLPEGASRTVAELGDDWKSRNSHRARAAAALSAALSAS